MEIIENPTIYLERMQKGSSEKMFWAEMILGDINTLIDFGAGDGSLFEWTDKISKQEIRKIAIENNEVFVEMLKDKSFETVRQVEELSELEIDWEHTVVIFSSVIHELFSYLQDEEAKRIIQAIQKMRPVYICVRDMIYTEKEKRSKSLAVQFNNLIKDHECSTLAQSFTDYWGAIENDVQAKHFLLKYKYVENWQREMQENYLPKSDVEIIDLFVQNEYETLYSRIYTNDFIKNQIEKDYACHFEGPTHLQLIVQKKG